MPLKNRRTLIPLGAIGSGEDSTEFDLSAFTRGLIHMKRDAGSELYVKFYSSPTPMGDTPDWYENSQIPGLTVNLPATVRQQQFQWKTTYPDQMCLYFPIQVSDFLLIGSMYAVLDTPVCRRMRLGLEGSAGLSWAYIEGLRSIA